ncbi:hypothetical protein MMPV_005770 [Pyropia vietnamensis]
MEKYRLLSSGGLDEAQVAAALDAAGAGTVATGKLIKVGHSLSITQGVATVFDELETSPSGTVTLVASTVHIAKAVTIVQALLNRSPSAPAATVAPANAESSEETAPTSAGEQVPAAATAAGDKNPPSASSPVAEEAGKPPLSCITVPVTLKLTSTYTPRDTEAGLDNIQVVTPAVSVVLLVGRGLNPKAIGYGVAGGGVSIGVDTLQAMDSDSRPARSRPRAGDATRGGGRGGRGALRGRGGTRAARGGRGGAASVADGEGTAVSPAGQGAVVDGAGVPEAQGDVPTLRGRGRGRGRGGAAGSRKAVRAAAAAAAGGNEGVEGGSAAVGDGGPAADGESGPVADGESRPAADGEGAGPGEVADGSPRLGPDGTPWRARVRGRGRGRGGASRRGGRAAAHAVAGEADGVYGGEASAAGSLEGRVVPDVAAVGSGVGDAADSGEGGGGDALTGRGRDRRRKGTGIRRGRAVVAAAAPVAEAKPDVPAGEASKEVTESGGDGSAALADGGPPAESGEGVTGDESGGRTRGPRRRRGGLGGRGRGRGGGRGGGSTGGVAGAEGGGEPGASAPSSGGAVPAPVAAATPPAVSAPASMAPASAAAAAP